MSTHNHNSENQGANPRDHAHPHKGQGERSWRTAHRDWRVQLAVVLMLALILVYVFTDSLSLRPGKPAVHPTPEALP